MELQLQNLALSFKNKPNVIHDISLTMNGGSIVGIVAPNGTGKTTLLRLILNDLKPQAGKVLVDGKVMVVRNKALRCTGRCAFSQFKMIFIQIYPAKRTSSIMPSFGTIVRRA